MKALTIRQPWADAIVHLTDNPKRTENRTFRTKYRGRLLIHTGLTGDRAAVLAGIPVGPDKRGRIIGVAVLADCHRATESCCPEWGFRDCWHWTLTDVKALPRPVPAKGRLGLWVPTADTVALIEGQYAEIEEQRAHPACPECDGDTFHQVGCQLDPANEGV